MDLKGFLHFLNYESGVFISAKYADFALINL